MSKIDELMRQGLQFHQAGRLPEAQAIYGKVLQKLPSHPAANHLLGLSLLQRGDAAGAVTRIQRAVHARGSDPEYLGHLGTALNAAGRPAEAVEAFDRALKLQPTNAGVLNNRAMALKALGRYDEAVASYRAAIAAKPDEAGFYRNLGNALSPLGDWHGAEAAYRRALELRSNFPNALTGLCNALQALQRVGEAVGAATTYAQRFPAESEYHRALGLAHWLAGDPAAAAAAYRAAIAANPADVEAHRQLGAIVQRKTEDAEVRAVETLLARTDLNDEQRAQLEFTLGAAFDDIGDAGRASGHFVRGNALIRKLRPFDIDAALARMEELKTWFTLIDPPPIESPTGPIFIVGLPRSGKTTLEGMLARHPDFFPAGELSVAGIRSSGVHQRGKDGAEGAETLGKQYLAMAGALAPMHRILDTMPNNFLLLGHLRLALPTARVLHCTRDPEAHAAALHRKLFLQGGNEYTSDPAALAAYMQGYRDLMSFWRQRFPDFIRDIDMADPAPEFPAVLGFLGAPWDAAVGAPFVSEPRLS